jgi:AcrR family transcriptional regulator
LPFLHSVLYSVNQLTEQKMAKASLKGARNREALVAAAARLFWLNGYHATSIADIAAEAGIPVGNVYYYFRTKADVAFGVADGFVDDTVDLLDAVAAYSPDPRLRLARLSDRLAASQKSRVAHGCPVAAAIREFRGDAPAASRRAAEVFTLISGFVATEAGRTGLRPALALGTGRAAVAEWQGGIVLGSALQDGPAVAESARRLARILAVGET